MVYVIYILYSKQDNSYHTCQSNNCTTDKENASSKLGNYTINDEFIKSNSSNIINMSNSNKIKCDYLDIESSDEILSKNISSARDFFKRYV